MSPKGTPAEARALVLSPDSDWGLALMLALQSRGYLAMLLPSADHMLADLIREHYRLVVVDGRHEPGPPAVFMDELRQPPWGPPCLLRMPDRYRIEWRGLGLDLAARPREDLVDLDAVLEEAEAAAKQIATLTGATAAVLRRPGRRPEEEDGAPERG